MALDLDIRAVEKLSEYFGGRPDTANISLREAIDLYTREKMAETLRYVNDKSPYYKNLLDEAGIDIDKISEAARGVIPESGSSVERGITPEGEQAASSANSPQEMLKAEWEKIPFTTQDDLREKEKELLCVSPSQISRIVTMRTSGTTGKPKRVYFTEDDQQLTVDFFNHGMRLIVDETDKVLILMGSDTKGSIGNLLSEGLKGMGVTAVEYGIPFSGNNMLTRGQKLSKQEEADAIVELIKNEGITSIVAGPTHMIAIARAAEKFTAKTGEEIYLRSILLSSEFVPEKTALMLEEVFQCMVFEHYGMTEMGLGCAVGCGYSRGYHIREIDLFIELINPMTGEVVKEVSNRNTPGFSNYGEIVFTTLTREGMPFVRYRTGDFSRWILGDCPCGSSLKRLDKVIPGDDRIDKTKGQEA